MALPTSITGFVASTGSHTTVTQPFISSGGNVYIFGKGTTASLLRAFKATDPTSSFSNIGTDVTVTSTNAISGIAAYQVGDNIHVITTDASAATAVDLRYHIFSMSSDSWTTSNETIKNDMAVVNSSAYRHIGISVRSDGDVIVVYNGPLGTVMGVDRQRVYYARREAAVWTVDVAVDNAGATDWYAGDIIIGASDRMHMFFIDEGAQDAYQRTLTSANSLEAFPASYDATAHNASTLRSFGTSYVSGANTKVRFPEKDATTTDVNSAKLDSADAPTVSLDTNITGATGIRIDWDSSSFSHDGTTLWHTLIDDTLSDIYTQSNADDGGWSAPASFFSGTSAISGVKTNIYTRGSDVVLAMMINDGTATKYHEKTLSSGGSAWSAAATASVTWTGISTAGSALSSTALASVTWTGNGLYPAALNAAAVASVTWDGATVAGATAADWSLTAAASVTWTGNGIYPAAFSSAAVASLTWNGVSTATSDWSSTAAASLTWNGNSTATAGWSAAAVATLTWDGAEITPAAWSGASVASVTWNGAEIAIVAAAWNAAAVASLTATGASTAASAWSSAAVASLTATGISTAAAAWNATAVASLTATGAATDSGAWSGAAVANLTVDGAEVTPGAWSATAAASVTFNGAEIATVNAAWNAAAVASLTATGASIAAAAWSSAVVASLTATGASTSASAWSSTAVASLSITGAAIDAGAWNASAVASLTMEGTAVSGAFAEAAWDSTAAASLTVVGNATATASIDADATASLIFKGQAVGVKGFDHINMDGWKPKRQRIEDTEDEDIIVIMAVIHAYLEQCNVYH